MPDQLRIAALLLCSVVVAVGVAVAGKFVGDGFRDGRATDRYVTVKGVAEREVVADLAVWPVRITETGDDRAFFLAAGRTFIRDLYANRRAMAAV